MLIMPSVTIRNHKKKLPVGTSCTYFLFSYVLINLLEKTKKKKRKKKIITDYSAVLSNFLFLLFHLVLVFRVRKEDIPYNSHTIDINHSVL